MGEVSPLGYFDMMNPAGKGEMYAAAVSTLIDTPARSDEAQDLTRRLRENAERQGIVTRRIRTIQRAFGYEEGELGPPRQVNQTLQESATLRGPLYFEEIRARGPLHMFEYLRQ